MPSKQKSESSEIVELLEALLIVELARAGAPQSEIREIVGGGIGRVNKIARHFSSKKRERKK